MTDTQTEQRTDTVLALQPICATQLANVALFAGADQARPLLTHVLFEIGADEVRIVATDSFALAIETLETGTYDMNGPVGSFMVPAKMVAEAAKMSKGVSPIVIRFPDEKTVTIETVGRTVSGETYYYGTFPDYRHLVPTGEPSPLPVIGIRADMVTRLGKVRHVDSPKRKEVELRFEFFGDPGKALFVKVGSHLTILQMPVRLPEGR